MNLKMLSIKEFKLAEFQIAGSSLSCSIMVYQKKVFLMKLCLIFIIGISFVFLVL